MNDQLLETILSNTYTTQAVNHRLALLKELLETTLFVEEKSPLHERIDAFFDTYKDDRAAADMKSWGEDFYREFTTENMYSVIEELRERAAQLPMVALYVPVAFSNDEITRIGEWFRKNINQHMMLNISVDPAVVGGCAFVWNGRYHNYSLSYFLEKHRNELIEFIDSYGTTGD